MTTKNDAVGISTTEVLIPLNKLKKSPRNARTTPHTEAAIEALAASIHAKGMLQNLVVEPERDEGGAETGSYYVTAGEGRRLAQLLRVKRRQIKKTEPVRCVVDATNDPLEVSLDENVTRASMHPAEQFEAFKRLSDEQGWGAEEIGARFGVTAHVVRQRMRLGAVSPRLMQLYREGDLTLEQLMAFAVSEDHARQEHVNDILRESWNRQPHSIRRVMMETHVETDDPRAIFVGEAYAEAGGLIVRDLFSEDGGGYLEDVALLDRLVMEKLNAVATEVQAEGWKWVAAHLDFPYDHGLRRVYPQRVELPARDRRRLDALQAEYAKLEERYDEGEELSEDEEARCREIEAEIERLAECQRVYDPDIIARSGAFVTLDRDGRARIERGFIRPEDELQREASDAAGDMDGVDHGGQYTSTTTTGGLPVTSVDDGTDDTAQGKSLPDVLVRDLTAHRTLGLRLALGDQPSVALIAVTHALAAQVFLGVGDESCLEIRATDTPLRGHAPGIDETAAARALAARHEAWAAQMPSDMDDLWEFVTDLDDELRMSLFAHCAAATVFAVKVKWDRRPRAQEAADRLAEAVSLNMAVHWQPTADAYLSRVSKAQIAEAVGEALSNEEAERISGMKKQAMAETAERLLAGTGWLPVQLRTSGSNGRCDEETSPQAA